MAEAFLKASQSQANWAETEKKSLKLIFAGFLAEEYNNRLMQLTGWDGTINNFAPDCVHVTLNGKWLDVTTYKAKHVFRIQPNSVGWKIELKEEKEHGND